MSKHFSFEFSAPRDAEATEKLLATHNRLKAFNPDFFSVTYGAGGSTKDGTLQAVLAINKLGSPVAPHLSFGGEPAEKIELLLNDYKNAGIRRVVALRGISPQAALTQ